MLNTIHLLVSRKKKKGLCYNFNHFSLSLSLSMSIYIIAERAGFLKKTLWVTPYDENQMFAGGDYCNQSSGKDTLEVWANSKVQDIEQKDIVVWYTFGITHLPRAEDFPIMPVEYCGFTMKPCNFFLRNPALDIEPTNASINQSVLANSEKNETCCSK